MVKIYFISFLTYKDTSFLPFSEIFAQKFPEIFLTRIFIKKIC